MADASLRILLDEPIGTINPNIYGHFIEHLGRCVDEGIWVGPDSQIPSRWCAGPEGALPMLTTGATVSGLHSSDRAAATSGGARKRTTSSAPMNSWRFAA